MKLPLLIDFEKNKSKTYWKIMFSIFASVILLETALFLIIWFIMPKHQVSHRSFNKKTYSLWTGSPHKDSAQRAAKSKRKEGYKARVVKVKLDDGGHSYAVYTRKKGW